MSIRNLLGGKRQPACKAADCLENVGALKSLRPLTGTALPFFKLAFLLDMIVLAQRTARLFTASDILFLLGCSLLYDTV
jgi:hypothetical protein